MSKESKILVCRILLNVRVGRAEQGNQHVDENDGSEEIPRIVDDQPEWISESIVGRVKIG